MKILSQVSAIGGPDDTGRVWVLVLVSLTRPKRLLVYTYNQWELLGGSKGAAKLHFLAKLHF